jgi:hypothetical protein
VDVVMMNFATFSRCKARLCQMGHLVCNVTYVASTAKWVLDGADYGLVGTFGDTVCGEEISDILSYKSFKALW